MRASAKSSANGKNSFKVRSSRSCSRRTAGTRGLQEVLDRGVQAPHDLVGTAAIQAVLLAIGLAICGVPGAAMLGFVALLPAIGQIGAPLLVLIWGGAAWWLFAQEQQIWGHVHNLPHRDGRFVGSAKRWAFVLALAATGIASISLARADEAQAKNLLKAMSDYLAAQKAISFDYDSNLEIVSTQQQKIGLASSGTLTLNRPDKLHATRTGGFTNVEMVFDGKALTLLGKNANLYAQVEAPGTIDQLVDVLRDKYHRPVPAADLLMSDPYKELMPQVKDAKDLGSGVIHGVECDHLAFRTKEVDWQIWIAQGARPYPCRYVITSKKVTGWPQYTLDIWGWKAGTEVASDNFKLEIPAGAKQLMPGQVPDLDEIPHIFSPKGAKS